MDYKTSVTLAPGMLPETDKLSKLAVWVPQ